MRALGTYRPIAELGRGGMATVFLAMTKTSEPATSVKLVVLKRMHERVAEDPDFVAMLLDEARIAARLDHANLIQTLDVDTIDDRPAIVMEYLDGQSLRHIHAQASPRFSREMRFAVLIDVLAGLHYAHELADFDGTPLNIVHRDVSPQNVFVTYDGRVKVLDFGIAKAEGRLAETQHGVVKGKLNYMSPEQARRERLDRRSDLFAVGIMLFEACTDRRMWTGMDKMDVFRSLVAGTYESSPRAVVPEVDAEIDAICRRALAPRLEDRYASADEFALELESYMRRHVPRPSSRELGVVVSSMFSDLRVATRASIERHLAVLPAKGDAIPLIVLPQTSDDPDSDGDRTKKVGPSLLGSIPAIRQSAGTTVRRQPGLARVLVLLAIALGALLVIAITLVPTGQPEDRPSARQPTR